MPLSPRARPGGAALWTPLLDRQAPLPVSRQLAAACRAAIAEGILGAGARLPSTRALAAELGLARSTVVGVFEQLAAEGYIAAQPGSGYFVPAGFLDTKPGVDRGNVKPPTARPISRPISRQGALLRELIPPARTPPRPFELGHADIDARLVATWKRLASRVLSGRSRLNWDYGDPQGEPALRQAIADYLAAARGVRCRPEQIVLTSGTQQGLSLAVRVLLNPGETACVEDPCYRATIDILRTAEAHIVPVAVDAHGLDIGAMRPQGPRRGQHQGGAPPRLVYTTPSRQYPLGMAMPLPRRMALLAWAETNGAWIVEDDYESEFQKPAQMLPSLQGLDQAGRVIYLGTFSKLVFPALRLGYAVLPEDLVRPFTAARHLADRQSSSLLQAIMTEFMLGGHFARHLKLMRGVYAERQDFLIEQAARRLGGRLDIRPQGCGMYLTAALPSGWSDHAVAAELAAARVGALPLSALTLATPRPPALVLGYAGHSEAAIGRAIERMAAVFDAKPV
jgi:GntR family transcriptional regulator/MocR family aminotransferase